MINNINNKSKIKWLNMKYEKNNWYLNWYNIFKNSHFYFMKKYFSKSINKAT